MEGPRRGAEPGLGQGQGQGQVGSGGRGRTGGAAAGGFWRPGDDRPASSLASRASLSVDAETGGGVGEGGVDRLLFVEGGNVGGALAQQQRQRLPVFAHRRAILYLVETHATTVLIGETGSGKTTQVPQFLVEAGWAEGGRMVACTQPRRVAAQSVAARVAEEMGVELGSRVGYCIRFEDVTTKGETQLKFLTDGVLLREMMEDPLLLKYSVIMVDEAHERTVATDILLGLLKKVQRRRPDLRLIIASATLEAETFAAFFDLSNEKPSKALPGPLHDEKSTKWRKSGDGNGGSEPSKKPGIMSIEGRCHPVELLYLQEPTSDYVQKTLDTILAIHTQEGPGDILAFLTGREEVDTLVQLVTEQTHSFTPAVKGLRGLMPMPLYAGLLPGDVEKVFAPVFRGQRKVIIATNIAEASITIEGVVYVIDCGFVKQCFYDPRSDVEALVVVPVSKASARQRAGRAGRTRAGKCFRLYTEESHSSLAAYTVPEIQRSNLASTVLQLKAMGVDNIMRFDWMSSPNPDGMIRALDLLNALGALDLDAKLTRPLGLQMAEIPLEPSIGKMLAAAATTYECSDEACIVAACLSVQSVWLHSRGRQREADAMKDRFAAVEGDFVTFLNIHDAYLRNGRSAAWCAANGLNYQAMARVVDVRAQLRNLLQRVGLRLRSCGTDATAIQKAAVCGFFHNAAELLAYGDGSTYRVLKSGLEMKIHPSSALFRVSAPWVVFREATRGESHLFMRDVVAIERSWLLDAAPHYFARRGDRQA